MAILVSIQPQWVEKILNGDKTIEIRKTIPKCKLPQKVYIYCTDGRELWGDGTGNTWNGIAEDEDMELALEYTPTLAKLNKKIVAEFILEDVERFDVPYPAYFNEVKDKLEHIIKKSYFTLTELHHYLQDKNGYAWYIKKLKIYDTPIELSKLYKQNKCYYNKSWFDNYGEFQAENCFEHCLNFAMGDCNGRCSKIEMPPQSWCYCEELEG